MSGFERLPGFAEDALGGFLAFRAVGETLIAGDAPLRAAKAPPAALLDVARAAMGAEIADAGAAAAFFVAHFELRPLGRGFLTGYYEPWVEGAVEPSREFAAPLLARPADLATVAPYPARAEIEAAGRDPVVWLQDAVEVFLIQVQGAARV